jgi:metallo-beta-lactamase class B
MPRPLVGAASCLLMFAAASIVIQPETRAAPLQTATGAPPTLPSEPPMVCSSCDEWNAPRTPFNVFGNTYCVGSMGLSSLLVATGEGLVLVDVTLPQNLPMIDANIRTLGFRTTDTKFILSSHGHFDHIGGLRGSCLGRARGASGRGNPGRNRGSTPATTWTTMTSPAEEYRCIN